MESAIVKLVDITPAGYNPRVDLKPGDREYESLKKSLERFGTVEPLIINRRTGVLVSGHQRLKILKEQGVEETEVIYVDTDEEQEKLLNLALNRVDGEWDFEKLEELFKDVEAQDIEFTGFTESEIESLFDYPDITGEGSGSSGKKEKPETKAEQPESEEKLFDVYLSFPSKEAAKAWLQKRGQEHRMAKTGGTTIRMEGADFDTGNRDQQTE